MSSSGTVRRVGRYIALTGTPGVGKSRVARSLGGRFDLWEVADLARAVGAGRRRGGSVDVDLGRLGRWLSRHPPPPGRTVLIVGHLAHLLPIREAIVLRAHPVELRRRLVRARRGRAFEREENVVAEALDLLLVEALSLGRAIREIDTTGRSPEAVARTVLAALNGPFRAKRASVDWLADPAVTGALFPRSDYPAPWSSRGIAAGRPRASSASRGRSSRRRRIG